MDETRARQEEEQQRPQGRSRLVATCPLFSLHGCLRQGRGSYGGLLPLFTELPRGLVFSCRRACREKITTSWVVHLERPGASFPNNVKRVVWPVL
jgi:hypothetical protein